ncbi:hypothetical protein ACFVFS_20315 [Kitasatospora sp. NPDC057692]|uniref:hypothetical protein n=1 Tax=Kitasatospora sp. NPDC057692 TaxID=3346215 RepID=UPI00369ECB5B
MPAPSSAFLGPLPAAPPPSPSHRLPGRARAGGRSRGAPGTHRAGRRARRLLVLAVLGLAVPLAVGPVAVAVPAVPAGPAGSAGVVPVPAAFSSPDSPDSPEPSPERSPSPEPSPSPEASPPAEASPEASGAAEEPVTAFASAVVPAAAPGEWRTGRPHPDAPWAEWERRKQRHHPGSAPERTAQRPERSVEQFAEQTVEHTPEQPPERTPEQLADPGTESAEDPSAGAGPADGSGSGTLALGGPGPRNVAAAPAVLPTRWDDASTRQFPLGAGLGLIGCGLGLVGLRLRRG